MSALVVALALPAFAERLHLYDWDIISSLSIELNLEYEVQIEGIFVFVTVPRISHIVGFTVVLGVGRWALGVGRSMLDVGVGIEGIGNQRTSFLHARQSFFAK